MTESTAFTRFRNLLLTLIDGKDYRGSFYQGDSLGIPSLGCEVSLSYYEFRVRIDNENDTGYDEFYFTKFGDLLKMLGMEEMVRGDWEDLSPRELEALDVEEILTTAENIQSTSQPVKNEAHYNYLRTNSLYNEYLETQEMLLDWFNKEMEEFAREMDCERWYKTDRKKWYKDCYLQSGHWRETKNAALKRAEYRCQICNKGKAKGRWLEVHHRTYRRLGRELPMDLVVLCNQCHSLYEKHHRLPKISKQSGAFDDHS